MIQNPILPGFCPDPSIIRVGEDYYIANSSFEWWPGVKIYHSKDLKHYEQLPSPLNRMSQLNMVGEGDSCGVWAPDISWDGEYFWLIYTDVKTRTGGLFNTHNYLVKSKDIRGGWSEPVYLNSSGFDPSVFHDTDGKMYIVNMINNFKETVKIYEQGKRYYDALKSVHDLVKGARKVQQTILLVGDISDIYVTNFNTMMGDPNFTVEELSAIAFGYNRLLEESSNLLLDLKEVTTATGLSMTDKERLDIINRIYGEVLEYKNLTWYYTRKNIGISYLRSKKKGDSQRVLALYGTHDQRYW